MSEVTIPNFGELLAEHLGNLPAEALPVLLANLERGAAERYRQWAAELTEFSDDILASADREDDIANRVEQLFPLSDKHQEIVDSIVPQAKKTYLSVFEGLTVIQQITIQANAERQGAAAWRGLAEAYPQFSAQLEQLALTEETNADQLDSLLSRMN
jgi:hypothetical protein